MTLEYYQNQLASLKRQAKAEGIDFMAKEPLTFNPEEQHLLKAGVTAIRDQTRRQKDMAKQRLDAESEAIYSSKLQKVQSLLDRL